MITFLAETRLFLMDSTSDPGIFLSISSFKLNHIKMKPVFEKTTLSEIFKPLHPYSISLYPFQISSD